MAAPQDIPADTSANQQRPSLTGIPISSSASRRSSMSRHHAHSVSLGTFNPEHRVTRRKSINANAMSNNGIVRTALNLEAEAKGRSSSHRRSLPSKGNRHSQGYSSVLDGSKTGMYTYGEADGSNDESAVIDDTGPSGPTGGVSKTRVRRASEGSHLGNGKRASGELRCEKCGKGYKHSSCLTKHLWEHTPEWALTSKLLVSKHQQVQILEAASVLVGMNHEGASENDIAKPADSDNNSSASPAASGSSDPRDDEDGYSSAETTPPPMNDQYGIAEGASANRSKRYSGNSSSFSRSYQSAPSSSLPGNGFAGLSGFGAQRRPSSSGLARGGPDDEEEASLVAAVQSLCSFGTPRTGAVLLPADIPPVPPLPARYVVDQGYQPSSSNDNDARYESELSRQATIVPEGHIRSDDVEMSDGQPQESRSSYRDVSKNRKLRPYDTEEAEDYDDGVFGGMEGLAHEAHETLNLTRVS